MLEQFIIPSFVRSWLDMLIEVNPKEKPAYMKLESQLNELQKNIDHYFTQKEDFIRLKNTYEQDLHNAETLKRESLSELMAIYWDYNKLQTQKADTMQQDAATLTPRQRKRIEFLVNNRLDHIEAFALYPDKDPATIKLFEKVREVKYSIWYGEKIAFLTKAIKAYLELHHIPVIPWEKFPETEGELINWSKNSLYGYYTTLMESRLAKTPEHNYARALLDAEELKAYPFAERKSPNIDQKEHMEDADFMKPSSEIGERMIKHAYKNLKYHFYQLYCLTIEEGWTDLSIIFLRECQKLRFQKAEFKQQIKIIPDLLTIFQQEVIDKKEYEREKIAREVLASWHGGVLTENLAPLIFKWIKLKTTDPSIYKETQKIIFITEILYRLNKIINGRFELLRREDRFSLVGYTDPDYYPLDQDETLEAKIEEALEKAELSRKQFIDIQKNPAAILTYLNELAPKSQTEKTQEEKDVNEITGYFWSGEFVRRFNRSKDEDGDFNQDIAF